MRDPVTPSEPNIQTGVCYVLFAYDTARSINLDDAERRIHDATQRDTIRRRRRGPIAATVQFDRDVRLSCNGTESMIGMAKGACLLRLPTNSNRS